MTIHVRRARIDFTELEFTPYRPVYWVAMAGWNLGREHGLMGDDEGYPTIECPGVDAGLCAAKPCGKRKC